MPQEWLRLYRRTINNPKVQRLGLDCIGFWTNCLCISDDHGSIGSAEDVAWLMRSELKFCEEYIRKLVAAGLLDNKKGIFYLHDWGDYQFKTDSTRYDAEKQKRYRETKKVDSNNLISPLPQHVVTEVTQGSNTLPNELSDALPPRTEQNRTEQNREEGSENKSFENGKSKFGSDEIAMIAEHWNSISEENGLASVIRITAKRRQKIKARIDEIGVMGLIDVISAIPSQPFLLGENKRGWKADFDWMLEPSNAVKIEERKYANGQA